MKKYLMLGAAALLLSTVAASAGTVWIKLDGHPDVFTITRHGDVYAQVHSFGNLVEGYGVGMAAATKDIGKGVVITDTSRYGDSKYICYDFQRPFRTGGSWEAYSTLNGRNVQWLGWGTYTVAGGQ